MDKKTPLYEEHVALGGKIVSYAGYSMPVQYKEGLIKEHLAVRNSCGIFDVSHMGEIAIRGKEAERAVQYLLSNNVEGMLVGQIKYSPMLNEQGGIVDDLLIYCMDKNDYLLVVNAANKDKDVEWIKANIIKGEVQFSDESARFGQIALQGPKAIDVLKKIVKAENIPSKFYTFQQNIDILGSFCIISRTGYTGEDGVEIYCHKKDTVKIWNSLLDAGREFDILPCGLGARDTLRLEAGLPLYGQEMSEDIDPFEAGIGFFVKMDKENFIGKKALMAKEKASQLKRIGFEIVGRGIARTGDKVLLDGREIGLVTSGTFAPYLQKAIGMALVEEKLPLETELELEVRGRKIIGKVVKTSFYDKRS